MIKRTLFLSAILISCTTLSCARTNVDIHGFTLIKKNIALQNILLVKFKERIASHEKSKLCLTSILQNGRITPQAYEKRIHQLNSLIKHHKTSQKKIVCERNKSTAYSATKSCLQEQTSQPAFNYSEIQKLQDTHVALTRGITFLQQIAYDEQQTLTQLQQEVMSPNPQSNYKSIKSMYTDINKKN